MKELVQKFDEGTLNNNDILEIKKAYKELTKAVHIDKHLVFSEDIYTSIETCNSCLRIAVNQIRYALNKKEIF